MPSMGRRQSGQVAATAVAAQRWMQAWQNACQHGSTPAGPSRGPKQMGQVSPRWGLLAAAGTAGTAGSCLDASRAAAGTRCPVSCWRDLLFRLLLAGLLMGVTGGPRRLRSSGGTQWLLGCWRVTTSGVPLAGLNGSGAAQRTPRLMCRWQYVTLAFIAAHRKGRHGVTVTLW